MRNSIRRWSAGAIVVFCLLASSQGATNFVWSLGSHTSPYSTWSTAATTVHAAVSFACANYPAYDTVVITNGTYTITNQIEVTNAIVVRSFEGGLAGADKTIVQRTGSANSRIFYMTHAQAVLDGLTIRNGIAPSAGAFPADRQGSGVWMSGGPCGTA